MKNFIINEDYVDMVLETTESVNQLLLDVQITILIHRIRNTSVGYKWIPRKYENYVYKCICVHKFTAILIKA